MKLIHYTDEEFALEPMEYGPRAVDWRAKPTGLWVSVEGKNDWKWWCEAEEFHLEHLNVSYEVILKENAKILHLKTAEEVLAFSKIYPYIKPQWDNPEGRRLCASYEINWDKVKKAYQGIVIAPYQWDCRMHNDCNWYYGWDCASGCIWDINCIKELKLMDLNDKEKSV